MANLILEQKTHLLSSSTEAYTRIRKDILDGEFELGQHLVEADLAEQYSMSRTPIRSALLRLQTEGLVNIDHGRGAEVCTYNTEDIDEIYSLRAELESYAAGIAAARISSEELGQLKRICEEMEAISSEDRDKTTIHFLVAKNNEFHHSIHTATRSSRMQTHLRLLTELPLVFKSYFWYTPNERARSFRYHRELIDALTNRDSRWAEALMKCHVYAAHDYMLQVMAQEKKETQPTTRKPLAIGLAEDGHTPR